MASRPLAPEFGSIIFRFIVDTWNSDDRLPPEHWSAGWLHLLAKPGKACNKHSALRPICLQHPVNKVVSGLLIQQVLDYVFPKLRYCNSLSMPIFQVEAPQIIYY